MIEKIISKPIIHGEEIKKDEQTTHIRVEEGNLIQYRCNPTPESGMRKVARNVTSFIPTVTKIERYISSYVIKTIGEEITTTFHYQA